MLDMDHFKANMHSKDYWRHMLLGSYDYKYLCMPTWPYCRSPENQRRTSPLFGLNDHLGLITALVMGFQHCLAMTAGLITPPILIGLYCEGPECSRQVTYIIQAALLVCAISTAIQVTGFRMGPFAWGSGILSVMGVSFTSVNIWENAISTMMGQGLTWAQAYGKMLGTTAFCAVTPFLISFLPFPILRRVFPPVVTSSTIMLIGINLCGTGFENWGGGAGCFYGGLCSGNGYVELPFGNAEYVGMGFFVFAMICVCEVFGSPFIRNGSVFLSLLVGYVFAVIVPSAQTGQSFVNQDIINASPSATFLWTTTFPLGVYAPAILPMIIVFLITSIECMGDTTATSEASGLETTGPILMTRIKGALLNDGLTSIFSSLAMSMPLTTFAQNNGVIALTNVGSRQAGWACAFWLLLLGIFAKFGGWVQSIPNCILGGMTTFLFANVISSGIKILLVAGPLRRRERFILTCGLSLGIGVTLVPSFPTNDLWPPYTDPNSAGSVFRASILAILESGFCLAAITTLILNLIIPQEIESDDSTATASNMKSMPSGLDKPFLDEEGNTPPQTPHASKKTVPPTVQIATANKEGLEMGAKP